MYAFNLGTKNHNLENATNVVIADRRYDGRGTKCILGAKVQYGCHCVKWPYLDWQFSILWDFL